MSCEFETSDREGVTVRCHHDTWASHIADEHLEMSGHQSAVTVTLRDPAFEYQDSRHLRRKIYYRPFVLPGQFNRYYVRVVVEYRGTGNRKRGVVVTAFASANIREGDILIWSKYETRTP